MGASVNKEIAGALSYFERRKTMANEVNCRMIFKEGVE